MIVLETERLILRRFGHTDAEPLERIFCDEAVMRFSEGVRPPEWIPGWIERCRQNDACGAGDRPWAVVEKSTQQTVGYCGLFDVPDVNGRPETEVGYRLARAYWGRGYATEAVRAVCKHAFHVLGLPRLIAMIDPRNTASIRVAEKAGMCFSAEVMFEGFTHPDCVYVISREQSV